MPGADSTLDRPILRTSLALPDRREGKVRDIYRVPGVQGKADRVLIVATDRISAFDVVMPTPMPGKGRLLTAISLGWFKFLRKLALVPDHLLSTDPRDVAGVTDDDRAMLAGRMMLCRRAEVVPIECVARGYLAGSGWAEYKERGSVCGVALPKGLRQCDKLPQPIFTPATKEAQGHDENITFDRACELVGEGLMERLRALTVEIYSSAAEYALARGMILADTKFEFGFALDAQGKPTEELLLVDEVLTPDSSRYWPLDQYAPGRDQPSYDKQYLRNYLLELVAAKRWDKNPPGPALPDDIVRSTIVRYEEARTRLGFG
ncbi:MAG: phosphoribosylaminoimidazolesuccinocarboxamide synthase [Phycisphaerales bacterium]